MTEAVEQEILSGTVEEIIFHNSDTGFTVLSLAVSDELVTVVGEVLDIQPGEDMEVTGAYTAHPTYGVQFKARLFQRKLPATAASIGKYLASGAIRGVGPVMAARLVDAFGDRTLDIMEKEPARMCEVKGISPKKSAAIAEEYRRIFGIRAVMAFLAAQGLDPMVCISIWKLWGNNAPNIIEADPYLLCQEEIGVVFPQADKIAAGLGIGPEAECRLTAGLLYVLRHNAQDGHVCLPRQKLLSIAGEFLQADSEKLGLLIDRMAAEEGLGIYRRGDKEYIYLAELYKAESYIAGRMGLITMLQCPPEGHKDYTKDIDKLEKELGITYAESQRQAIGKALCHSAFILTGGPGTGKTTTLNGIIRLLESAGEKVALAAPTGRAAKRMAEVTGREAKTIHRLLEVDAQQGMLRFKRNDQNPLACNTVIVDEMSMVDTRLFEALLRGIQMGCRLVMVGDPDQLPSVGAGNVLRDLISCGVLPSVHLQEVFRQAAESLIVTGAHAIVSGEVPELTHRDGDFFFLTRNSQTAAAQTVVELCQTRLPTVYDYSPLWDIQVIVPGRKGALGTEQLNVLLQGVLNPADKGKVEQTFGWRVLREGDKVMQVRNNYDIVWSYDNGEEGTGVFNGDIGVIEMIDRPSQTILVRYDDRTAAYTFEMAADLEHAYAITIHKSQGSEFEAVVMPLDRHHPKLHYRNLLYTGVTRAKKLLIMLGRPETVAQMVGNHRRRTRYTNLREMIEAAVKGGGEG